MERSRCTSCGSTSQLCQCRRQQVSSTRISGGGNPEAIEITPAYCCSSYLWSSLFFFVIPLIIIGFVAFITNSNSNTNCYLELFADSVSVVNANANNSAADWKIHFVLRTPLNHCKVSISTITFRLLRGNEVISTSSADFFGKSVRKFQPVTTVEFKTVATPPDVIGVVIWDFRVEIFAGVRADLEDTREDGFLTVFCSDLPVKFGADPAGNVMGSLLGNIRRCDYSFRHNLI